MRQSPQYPPRGVVGRNEQAFNDVLYEQIRRTPWWLLSVSIHAVLIVAMWSLTFATGSEEERGSIDIGRTPEKMDDLELVEPVVDEIKPIEIEEPPPDDAFIDDIAELTESEEVLVDDQAFKDDPRAVGPFIGEGDNREIGIGGAAGGGGGGFSGRRKLRAESRGRSEGVVDLGLEWLKNHQSPEGYWDCDGFEAECELNKCGGAGHALYDPGVSGLALLAFLGTGETHRTGKYRQTVRMGLKYLKQIQDPEGCFGPRTTSKFIYNHGCAALAMTEAYGLTGSPLFRQSAQSAIDFIIKCQNPYLGWRYGVRPQDNDTSVMGWMIMVLKSAQMAGSLRVPEEGFNGAKAWIEKATEPEYGKVGYVARGDGPARPRDIMDRFPSQKSEAMTAVGVLTRIFLGEDPERSEMIRKGVDLCTNVLPEWDEAGGSIDHYYWYYGSLALFQVGGEPWKQWNRAMKTAIIDHQRKDGDAAGSWDPIGPWGREGGRVYSTALCTMCLEVYYRYPRVIIGADKK